ncbi:MAG: NAD-dependent epimerase/dehydratase family protein [Gammaproteobacteria bacterium]|nr:NAD-dependent epimerase/dehydratase family protein [Gammaproteobacteria bacterium]
MNKGRRQFITSGLVGGALVGSGLSLGLQPDTAQARDDGALSILVLGGTGFIGPHMVREALRRGHEVTLFNRGRTNNELFPDLETLIGDRDNGLDELKGRTWDAVIDNSGYVPRHVHDSASLLSSSVGHYLYISTVSVYASFANPLSEDSPLATMDDESIEEVTGETYGPLKALCEKRAEAAIGSDRLTVLRPTYICGPGDRTDRYTYWPVRTMDGGSMLWPGKPSDPIQIIDVRDLANFTIDCVERRHAGIYNTVTPPGEFTIGDLLADSVAVTGAAMNPTWVDYEFIRETGLNEGRKLPIWVSPESDSAGGALASGERALNIGLHNRPTRETARDTVSWWKTLPAERTGKLRAGLSREEEVTLLEQWHAANS